MKQTQFSFAPFVYAQKSILQKDIVMLAVLSLYTAALIFSADYAALLHVAVCIAAVSLMNLLSQLINREKLWFDAGVISEAAIIALCVPTTYNSVILFILVALSYFIVKVLFAGRTENIFSITAFTVALLYLSFPAMFPESLNNIALLKTHGNMLSVLQIKGLIKNDKHAVSLLNYFFANIGVVIPEGYINMLHSNVSVIPAFRYNILTLISSAVLLAYGIGDKLVSYVFVGVYAFLVWGFAMYRVDGALFDGDILASLCTTGILFYAFFVATERSTIPHSIAGKMIYAVILAVTGFFLCGPGGSPVGIAFAVLLANICMPVIYGIEQVMHRRFIRKHYGKN